MSPRGERGADLQARAAALLGVDVVVGDRDQSRRAAGFASVTTSAVISLVIEAIGSTACAFLLNSTSSRVLVEHQGDARLQLERIGVLVQAGQLAERRTGRLERATERRDAAHRLRARRRTTMHGGLRARPLALAASRLAGRFFAARAGRASAVLAAAGTTPSRTAAQQRSRRRGTAGVDSRQGLFPREVQRAKSR